MMPFYSIWTRLIINRVHVHRKSCSNYPSLAAHAWAAWHQARAEFHMDSRVFGIRGRTSSPSISNSISEFHFLVSISVLPPVFFADQTIHVIQAFEDTDNNYYVK